MGDIVKIENNSLISLLHGKSGEISVPRPFEKDVFLMDTHAEEIDYMNGIDEVFDSLEDGKRVFLFREPDNPHDEMAIVICMEDGQKIGYVPRKDNLVLARLMDAGKQIYGKVISKYRTGSEVLIRVKIFLHD